VADPSDRRILGATPGRIGNTIFVSRSSRDPGEDNEFRPALLFGVKFHRCWL